MSIGVIVGLVNAETNYFGSIGRSFINFDKAIKNNRLYSDKLLELYSNTTNNEDRIELEQEITYLHKQVILLKRLRDTQLNNPEDIG